MVKSSLSRMCLWGVLASFMALSAGCTSVYYKTMEAFGKHKRDILVDRVKSARDAQTDAKQQFQTALERFSAVVTVSSGELQRKYGQLKTEVDKSEARAQEVSSRIADVESVAQALFEEWQTELEQYTNKDLRHRSELELKQTQGRYDQLMGAMKQAERKTGPVLAAFRDHVLFLKHNLNGQAVASLKRELVPIESNVASLLKDMDASVTQANKFVGSLVEE
jgi:hypothetical protein